MNVKELIEELKKLPHESEVRYVYDGDARASVNKIWLAKSGIVILSDFDEYVSHEMDFPINESYKKGDVYNVTE